MDEIRNFMYYMCSDWCLKEAIHVFGLELGRHIWHKMFNEAGNKKDLLFFFAGIDKDCQQKIVDRVHELYPQK